MTFGAAFTVLAQATALLHLLASVFALLLFHANEMTWNFRSPLAAFFSVLICALYTSDFQVVGSGGMHGRHSLSSGKKLQQQEAADFAKFRV